MAKVPDSTPHDTRERINAWLQDFWEKIGAHHMAVSGRPLHGVPAETDMSAGAEGLRIDMELPGLEETDIEVSVQAGMLTISGEKRVEREVADRAYHVSQRAYGRFERQFALPDSVDADKIAASYGNGVLTVSAPRKKGARSATKKIKIASR